MPYRFGLPSVVNLWAPHHPRLVPLSLRIALEILLSFSLCIGTMTVDSYYCWDPDWSSTWRWLCVSPSVFCARTQTSPFFQLPPLAVVTSIWLSVIPDWFFPLPEPPTMQHPETLHSHLTEYLTSSPHLPSHGFSFPFRSFLLPPWAMTRASKLDSQPPVSSSAPLIQSLICHQISLPNSGAFKIFWPWLTIRNIF